MVKRFQQLRRVISEIVIDNALAPHMPSAVEIKTLNQLTAFFNSFEFSWREAPGEKFVPISKILAMLICLSAELNSNTSNWTVDKEHKDVLLRELKKSID